MNKNREKYFIRIEMAQYFYTKKKSFFLTRFLENVNRNSDGNRMESASKRTFPRKCINDRERMPTFGHAAKLPVRNQWPKAPEVWGRGKGMYRESPLKV
jgi:hypothetical protein